MLVEILKYNSYHPMVISEYIAVKGIAICPVYTTAEGIASIQLPPASRVHNWAGARC